MAVTQLYLVIITKTLDMFVLSLRAKCSLTQRRFFSFSSTSNSHDRSNNVDLGALITVMRQ